MEAAKCAHHVFEVAPTGIIAVGRVGMQPDFDAIINVSGVEQDVGICWDDGVLVNAVIQIGVVWSRWGPHRSS